MTTHNKGFDGISSMLQTGTARQLIFMIGVAVSVALGIALYMSIQEPVYRPLDYQLSQKNMATIVDTLEKANIPYKINDRDNMIMVPAKDVENAKLKLSSTGIPKDDGINYSFLNEQSNLANSQFMENARYLRALENDLSKTVSSIEGVLAAKVHIAIPQNNVFADENNKVTASVVLTISPGFSSEKERVRSIMQIIADSVPGLDPKDVAITDQYGHFLSEGIDQNSVYSGAQLSYQNNIQSYYEKRIESMIVPILGQNKVIVRVNADIDFTTQENAQEEYDPAKSAVLSEQSDIVQSDSAGGASGAPGSLSNAPPDNGAAPAAGGAPAAASAAGGQKRTQSTKNFNVGKSVVYKRSNYAKIKNLSVALVVDNEMILDPKTKQYVSTPLTADKINKITELVKTSIGFDQARGDKVTVINSSYTQTKVEMPIVQPHLWDMPWFWDTVKRIIGIILGFMLLFIIYRKISNMSLNIRMKKQKSAFVPEEHPSVEENNDSLNRMHELKQDGMVRLKQLASVEPGKVAMVLKNWVGK